MLAWIFDIVPEIFGHSPIEIVCQNCDFIFVARFEQLSGNSEKFIVNYSVECRKKTHEKDEVADLRKGLHGPALHFV